MAQNTFALMTNLGRAKEAAAIANGTAVVITHIAIGDGATVPSGGETALYHEVARKAISGHGTVVGASNVAYFDIFLEAAEGPYTIREAGLIDEDGDLIAIARYDPPISKPIPSSGQTVEGTIRLEVAFSNIGAVTIVVDPSFKVALQRLNRLPWLPVISITETAPPAVPTVGDVYLVASGATGAWSGQSGKIVEYTAAGWGVIAPPNGHGISLPDGRVFERVGGQYIEKIALDAQSGKWNYALAAGTLNDLTALISPTPLGYASMAGCTVHILPVKTNSGPSTLNLNGLGAKAIKSGGSELRGGEIVEGCICTFVFDGDQWQYVGVVQQRVSIPTTIFVNPETGNDTNNGASAGAAFKTLQRAVDVVARMYLEDVDVTIQCAPSVNYKKVRLRQFSGSGRVLIIGDRTTPANCRLTDAGNCFNNSGVTGYSVYGFRLESTGAGGGEISTHFAVVGGQLSVGDMEYGPSTQYHLYASDGGVIITSHNQKIVGVSSRHAVAVNNSTLRASSSNQPKLTVAVSGAFVEFVRAERGSVIDFAYYSSITVTGTITGIRAMAITNGIVNTSGGGNNYFPGNAAPVTQTGGQYI